MGLETEAWKALVSSALVGTERQMFQPPVVYGKLGEVLQQLQRSQPNQSPEAVLLKTAAVLSLHRQVGRLPETRPIAASQVGETSETQICDQTDMPRCSLQSSHFLQRMLQGEYAKALPEWLEMAAQLGLRAPEMALPQLLDLGNQQFALRERILPVLGGRGRWLAAQNPAWSYAVEMESEQDWDTGSSGARLLWLSQMRIKDPELARIRLSESWKQESASDRAAFLSKLQINLSMADEPFLEAALDDRSKEVRRVAAELLVTLPEARFCHRMTERLRMLIAVKVTSKQTCELFVSLPDQCDAAMQRDGIEPKLSTGERAGWLLQLIQSSPLQVWQSLGVATAAEWLKLVQASDWQEIFVKGWRYAAYHQRNPEWAMALLPQIAPTETEFGQLLNVLEPKQKAESVQRLLQEALKDRSLWALVSGLTQQRELLDDELARLLLTSLHQAWSTDNVARHWEFREILKMLAFQIPAHLLPEAALLQPAEPNSPIANAFEEFLATLQFRQEMSQAFHAAQPTV